MKRPPADHIISEEKAISVACPKCKEKFLVLLPPNDSQLKLEAAAQECEEMAAMVQHIHNCRQRDLAKARAEATEEAIRALSQSPRPESDYDSAKLRETASRLLKTQFPRPESEGEAVSDQSRHDHISTECSSEQGITICLIDGIIAQFRLLQQRDLSSKEVQYALEDLARDEFVKNAMNDPAYRVIDAAAQLIKDGQSQPRSESGSAGAPRAMRDEK